MALKEQLAYLVQYAIRKKAPKYAVAQYAAYTVSDTHASEPRPNTLKSLTHDWDCFLDAIQTFPNLVVIILVKYGVSL